MSWIKEKNNSVVLTVHVVPGTSRTEIVGPYGDALKIKLNAPPVDGKANEELIRFLSKKFKTPKSNIEIMSGFNQKRKILSIRGLKTHDIQLLLK